MKLQTEKSQIETLVTNGLGSYSLCSAHGEAFRKYHGLMTIATQPPVNRIQLLSDFAILCSVDGLQWQPFSPEQYGAKAHPIATEQWVNSHLGLTVIRKRTFEYGHQRLAVRYTFKADKNLRLRLVPRFNIRDHHDTLPVVPSDYGFGVDKERGLLKVVHPLGCLSVEGALPFTMAVGVSGPSTYAIETERGYPDTENHMEAGYYSASIAAGEEAQWDFVLSYGADAQEAMALTANATGALAGSLAEAIFAGETKRQATLIEKAAEISEPFRPLVYAADQFIAKRSTTGKASILAGFPWFTDWGRDTMISIPGLCLATGRAPLALEMIETFLAHSHAGIIPNNFPDQGEAPMYNTVDGTLWLFQAFYAYWQETGDRAALEKLYPVLTEVMTAHLEGTINNIHVDSDGLLISGDPSTQLTWMDVKVEGWVVTPRHDKAVEINALFYNALCILAALAETLGDTAAAARLKAQSEKLKEAFHRVFWNSEKQYLNDLFMEGEARDMIRPNMLFAISLPFPVLESVHWEPVVAVCQEHLYFDYGLRSLSPKDPEYCGIYRGNLLARDGAYHRGTGWGWLLGPFLEAHYKTHGDRAWVLEALKKALAHLEEGALGTFAENFDGDAPHLPRGCCAQAWSVAEVLRLARLVKA